MRDINWSDGGPPLVDPNQDFLKNLHAIIEEIAHRSIAQTFSRLLEFDYRILNLSRRIEKLEELSNALEKKPLLREKQCP